MPPSRVRTPSTRVVPCRSRPMVARVVPSDSTSRCQVCRWRSSGVRKAAHGPHRSASERAGASPAWANTSSISFTRLVRITEGVLADGWAVLEPDERSLGRLAGAARPLFCIRPGLFRPRDRVGEAWRSGQVLRLFQLLELVLGLRLVDVVLAVLVFLAVLMFLAVLLFLGVLPLLVL